MEGVALLVSGCYIVTYFASFIKSSGLRIGIELCIA